LPATSTIVWDVEEKLDASYASAVGGRDKPGGVSLSPGKGPLPPAELAQRGCDRLEAFISFSNFLRFAVE